MQVKRETNKLTITVDLDPTGRPSSTGKTTILYTSSGFQYMEGLGINLTVIKSKR